MFSPFLFVLKTRFSSTWGFCSHTCVIIYITDVPPSQTPGNDQKPLSISIAFAFWSRHPSLSEFSFPPFNHIIDFNSSCTWCSGPFHSSSSHLGLQRFDLFDQAGFKWALRCLWKIGKWKWLSRPKASTFPWSAAARFAESPGQGSMGKGQPGQPRLELVVFRYGERQLKAWQPGRLPDHLQNMYSTCTSPVPTWKSIQVVDCNCLKSC